LSAVAPIDLTERMLDPWKDPALNRWLTALHERFRYLAMLGLPDAGDRKDVEVKDLYVGQKVSSGGVSTIQNLTRVLVDHPRVAVLGEAGTGKSTLIHWLVTQFAGWEKTWMNHHVGRMVPLPLILRDMTLSANLGGFDGLLDALPAGRGWTPELRAALPWDRGQVWVMVDGLDEVTQPAVRNAVRDALAEGMRRYPDCRFLVTSRPLGWREVGDPTRGTDDVGEVSIPRAMQHSGYQEWQLEPFTDEQVATYAERWYTLRVGDAEEAKKQATELVSVLGRDASLGALARNPNLLTLTLIVHRTYKTLPSGRAVLYDKIVEAYLESIDRARRIQSGPVRPELRRRWLSALAVHMQERRFWGDDGESEGVVIPFDEAVQVIVGAARIEGATLSTEEGGALLRGIAERSGLLLPRSNGALSFTHLSFQDYFAARSFVDRLQLAYFQPKVADAAIADLQRWAAKPSALETLRFAFQALADKPGMGDGLARSLFVHSDSADTDHWDAMGALATSLLDEEGVGIAEARPSLAAWVAESTRRVVAGCENSGKAFAEHMPSWVRSLAPLASVPVERLAFSSPPLNAADLWHVPLIKCLHLSRTDLEPMMLEGLPKLPLLERLAVTSEHAPKGWVKHHLIRLRRLKELFVGGPSGAIPLEHPHVRKLYVIDNPLIRSTKAIGAFPDLTLVYFMDCAVLSDLASIGRQRGLSVLYLENCPSVVDLSPLAKLPGPGTVVLEGPTGVPLDHPPRIGNFEIVRKP
jgi:internalin A